MSEPAKRETKFRKEDFPRYLDTQVVDLAISQANLLADLNKQIQKKQSNKRGIELVATIFACQQMGIIFDVDQLMQHFELTNTKKNSILKLLTMWSPLWADCMLIDESKDVILNLVYQKLKEFQQHLADRHLMLNNNVHHDIIELAEKVQKEQYFIQFQPGLVTVLLLKHFFATRMLDTPIEQFFLDNFTIPAGKLMLDIIKRIELIDTQE